MSRQFSSSDIQDGKMFAFLSYISILCIIPLILKKQNPFVLFHGKQGLVLFVIQTALLIGSIILPGVFIKASFFVVLLLSFWGMIAVLQGKAIELPIIARWAEQISL